jgi:zinc finger CCHC domain-containing protein 9
MTIAQCFKCRKSGHTLRQCREVVSCGDHHEQDTSRSSNQIENKAGSFASLCFRCGSNSHSLQDCSEPASFMDITAEGVMIKRENLPYTSCFICGEKGHLSRHCLQNSNGVYPKGGGCRFCGSKWHFVKECPTKFARQLGQDHSDSLKRDAHIAQNFLEPVLETTNPIAALISPSGEHREKSLPKKKKEIIF